MRTRLRSAACLFVCGAVLMMTVSLFKGWTAFPNLPHSKVPSDPPPPQRCGSTLQADCSLCWDSIGSFLLMYAIDYFIIRLLTGPLPKIVGTIIFDMKKGSTDKSALTIVPLLAGSLPLAGVGQVLALFYPAGAWIVWALLVIEAKLEKTVHTLSSSPPVQLPHETIIVGGALGGGEVADA